MRSRRAYLVISLPSVGPTSRPGRHRPGRHRADSTGTVRRPRPRLAHRYRARHRRRREPTTIAARYGGLLTLAGTLVTSGWFSVSGATAFAQMIQP